MNTQTNLPRRPDTATWASKEHFDAAWSAFGATSFEDLHQRLSIHDIKRLFAMFAEVAQRPAMKPLTDEQIGLISTQPIFAGWHPDYVRDAVRIIEAAHNIKEQA